MSEQGMWTQVAALLRRRAVIYALIVAGLVWAAWPYWRLRHPDRDHEPNAFTTNMKTVCVGRELLDVPAQASFSIGAAALETTKIEALDLPVPGAAGFAQYVRDREADLRASRRATEASRLQEAADLGAGKGRIFVYRGNGTAVDGSNIEAFVSAVPAVWRLASAARNRDVPAVKSDMDAIARSLRYRPSDSIPADAGVCVQNGLLGWSAKGAEEFHGGAQITSAYWSLNVATETSALVSLDQQLFARMDAMLNMASGSESGTKKLRRAQTQLGGRAAQEFVVLHRSEQADILDARIESYGDGTIDTPTVKIEMEVVHPHRAAGASPDGTLSDEEALAIWDAVLKSVRLRAGATRTAQR